MNEGHIGEKLHTDQLLKLIFNKNKLDICDLKKRIALIVSIYYAKLKALENTSNNNIAGYTEINIITN